MRPFATLFVLSLRGTPAVGQDLTAVKAGRLVDVEKGELPYQSKAFVTDGGTVVKPLPAPR